MKTIKIDQNGILEIERGTNMKIQNCWRDSGKTWCTDSCPLFGEPEYSEKDQAWTLDLCCKKLIASNMIDERK